MLGKTIQPVGILTTYCQERFSTFVLQLHSPLFLLKSPSANSQITNSAARRPFPPSFSVATVGSLFASRQPECPTNPAAPPHETSHFKALTKLSPTSLEEQDPRVRRQPPSLPLRPTTAMKQTCLQMLLPARHPQSIRRLVPMLR